MAEKSSFFNSVSGDRKYSAEDWAAYFSSFVSNGVFAIPSNSLQVVISYGMGITIKAGSGFINGYFYRNTTDLIRTLSVADGIYNRIDRVVLRWSLINRNISIQVLQGDTDSSDQPTPPALTRNAEVYDIALADIHVDAGATSVVQSKIDDLRSDSDLCGFVTGVVDQLDFSTLCTQFNAFFAEYRQRISDEYERYISNGQDRYDIFDSRLNQYEESAQQNFTDWFDNLQYILDGDVAGHLQNEIDAMTEIVKLAEERINASLAKAAFSEYEHSKSGTVHALVLTDGGNNIRFTATAVYAKGDTFTINGNSVEVLLPSGKAPGNNFFVKGAAVIGMYNSELNTLYLVGGGGGGGSDQVKISITASKWYKTAADSDGKYWNAVDISIDGFDPSEQRVQVAPGDAASQTWIAEHGYYEVLQSEDKITILATEVPAANISICYQISSTEQGGGTGQLIGACSDVVQPRTAHVYGIAWNFGNANTQCSRLEEATNFAEPTPAVGTGTGSSPFDKIYPWSEMEEYNVISGEIKYKQGDDGFSRTSYDTVVKIPKFWFKAEQDSNEFRLYISSGAKDGFMLHPAFNRGDGKIRDAIYVGKYKTSAGYATRSGFAPLVSITRKTFRDGAASKGTDWWGYDIATYSAICMLYLVEFADWNTQSVIGAGNTNTSAAKQAGGTDAMSYHTGRAAGTNDASQIQYRHLESLWGDVRDLVDGINFSGSTVYFCLIPSKFADDTATNYTILGYTVYASGGNASYPKSQGLDANNPWLWLPVTVGGSTSSYIPDAWWSNTGWRIFSVGGTYGYGAYAGLFARNAYAASSDSDAALGGRLLFLP